MNILTSSMTGILREIKYASLLYLIFQLFAASTFGQSGTCSGAEVFCGSDAYHFPTSVSTSAEVGPCYACLGNEPNPAWYFMQAGSSGSINITMVGMSNGDPPDSLDIDYICWGPFTSPTGACLLGLTCDKVISCSYSPYAREVCIIPNAVMGKFYMLMITNYSNQVGNITFQQSNAGIPGAGTTNCNIVVDCSLLALSPNPSACSPTTGLYTLNGIAEFTNPPTTGELIIKDPTAVPAVQISLTPPFVSPLNFSIPDIPCDGTTHNLYGYFTGAGNTCELSDTYQAPAAPCPGGVITGGGPVCDDGISQTTINISVAGAPGPYNIVYARDGVNQPPITNYAGSFPIIIPTSTPGTYTLVSTSNGTCSGTTSGSAVVTLVPIPAAPVVTATPAFTCGNGTVSLSVIDNPGIAINWYSNATGGTPLFTGNPFVTPIISATTTYYAESITLTGNCKSTTRTPVIAEVRPVPNVSTSNQHITNCTLDPWSFALTSIPSGATFTWMASCAPAGAVNGFTTPGAGSLISDVLTNTINVQGIVTYQVIPSVNSCSGPATNFTVTVKPVPHLVNSTSQPVCSGGLFTASLNCDVAGGNFTWTATSNPAGSITGFSAVQNTGTNTINETLTNTTHDPATVIYHLLPMAGGCTGPVTDFTVVVKPAPHLTNSTPAPICSGTAANILLLSDVAGSTFTWTATASPAGTVTNYTAVQTSPTDIITDPPVNSGNTISTITYLITPSAGGCPGAQSTLLLAVNPVPQISCLATQTVCSGALTAAVTLSSTVAGTIFNWTADCPAGNINPCPVVPGSSNPIPGMNFMNVTNSPQTVTFTVNSAFSGCSGSSATHAITINPSPTVSNWPLEQSLCSGSSSTLVNLTSSVNGTTFQWTATPTGPVTGFAASGTSSIPVQNMVVPQGSNGYVTYHITPSFTGSTACPGAPVDYKIMVNTLPAPLITGESIVCELKPNVIYHTPASTGDSYQWTINGASSVNNQNTSDVTVTWGPYTSSPGTLSVTETIDATGCQKTTPVYPVVLQQRPVPGLTSPAHPICEGSSGNRYETEAGMTGYTWNVTGGATTAGGNTTSSFAIVSWNTPGNFSVEVNYMNTLGCTGFPSKLLPVTVNPLPVTTITPGTGPNCEGALHTFNVPSDPLSTFNWSILPAGRGTVASGQGTTSAGISWNGQGASTVVVTGTTTATACSSTGSITVDVHPKPLPVFIPCFDVITTPQAKKITLKGASPFIAGQGVFSGNRVSYIDSNGVYIFDPLGASAGTYPITYSVTNNFGCSTTTPPVNIIVQNSAFSCGGNLTDVRDGKIYKTTSLSGKCWMAENLNYGTSLTGMHGSPQTDNCTVEKYCSPSDASCADYGGLYQWDELMDFSSSPGSKGLCPPAWHVPTSSEWQLLIDNLIAGLPAPHANATASAVLKDTYVNNSFGAILGGILYQNDVWAFNNGLLTSTMYWTSTPDGPDRAMARGLNKITSSVSTYSSTTANAFPVRCVKD